VPKSIRKGGGFVTQSVHLHKGTNLYLINKLQDLIDIKKVLIIAIIRTF